MRKARLKRSAKFLAIIFLVSTACQAWAGVNIVIPKAEDIVGGANIICVVELSNTSQEVLTNKQGLIERQNFLRPVTRLEFLVDGQVLTTKSFPTPTTSSGATFVWDSTGVPSGKHRLTVRAISGNTVVGSDTVDVIVSNDGVDLVPPQVHIYSPKPGSTVQGQVPVAIHASDNSGVAMITLFIDKELKLLQNVPPFEYVWDTTRYPNGPHTIEVWAYDRAQNKSEARPVTVRVANETGRTDLQAQPEPSAPQPNTSAAQSLSPKSPSQTGPQTAEKQSPAQVISPSTPKEKAPTTARKAPGTLPKPQLAAATQTAEVRNSVAPLPPARTMLAKAFPSTAAPRFELPSAVSVQPPQTSQTPSAKTAQPAKPAESTPKRAAPTGSTAVAKQDSSKPVQTKTSAAPSNPKPSAAAAREPLLSTPAYSPPSPKLLARVPDLPQPELKPTKISPLASPPKKVEGTSRATSAQPANAPKYPKPANNTPLSAPPFHATSVQNSTLKLVLQDKPIPVDVPPVVKNGKALVPFRQVFEQAGGIVVWVPNKKIVHGQALGKNVTLTIGSKRASVNGQAVLMEYAAFIQNGRTIVPVQFLKTSLEMQVVYDPKTKIVRLYLHPPKTAVK
ncbi:MAG: stalk domain-containing protein [Armatimonadota bacterium]